MEFSHILVYAISFLGLFTSSLFLITFFDEKNKMKFSAKQPETLPAISLIIPVYNGEKGVAKTIKNALSIDYPKDKIEIIVVDDGSSDKSYEVAKGYEKYGVKVFKIQHGGKGKALNFAIKQSKGEFIANLDSDSFVDKDILLKMAGFFENPDVMAVTPSIKIWKPQNIIQKIQMIEFLSSSIARKVFSYLGAVPLMAGACSLFRRKFFEKHGGYKEDSLTEDCEMSLRIENNNYLIQNAMDTSVYTSGVKTFRQFFNQRLRWFKGLLDSFVIHKSLFNPKRGNIAVILYLMMSSVLLGMISFGYGLVKFSQVFIQNISNFYSIGFDASYWFDFTFDYFNINTAATIILPSILIICSAFFIYLCKKYSKERQKVAEPFVLSFFTYWFFVAAIWISAIYYKVSNKKIKWGSRYL